MRPAIMKSWKNNLLLYLKGIAMGAADAVPGVSGGTIAFISGIYETLIMSIRSFDITALKLFFKGNFKGAFNHVNGSFLIVLLSGIGTSILVFSRVILYLLQNHPELIWSFFFGLIIASALVIAKKIETWNFWTIAWLFAGIGAGYFITIAVPSQTPETAPFVFLSGMIAICAMILPGISGSFILVLLSKYEFIFTAIRDFQIYTIAVFGSGCAIGILAFSHLLSWTLKKFYGPTIAGLTGLMLGSLNKVWPWKEVIETYKTHSGKIKPLMERNILPTDYFQVRGKDPYRLWAVILIISGFCLVYFFERLSQE